MIYGRQKIRLIVVTICAIAIVSCAFFLFLRSDRTPARFAQPMVILREFHFAQLHMAMKVQLTVWCESQPTAESACKEAFRRITALESVFNDYDANSEIGRLTVAAVDQPMAVSDELWEVLTFSKRLNEMSQGAFDPTLAPVIELWRAARSSGVLPDPQAISSAQACTGFDKLVFDEKEKTVACRVAGMKLDLGGIAKGYIGDQVLMVLQKHGIDSACYEAGGDFVLGEAPPNSAGWEINLEVGENVTLANCGVAVSGDSVQFVVIDGKHYSHVVDPNTGIGLTTRQMAWVIAPRGMESDSLATTGTILPEDDFQRLLRSFPHTKGWSKVR